MLKRNTSYFCILLTLFYFVATDVMADSHYQIVTHPDVNESNISKNYLRAIFSMRLRTWPNGVIIKVFVLPDDHKLHHEFSKEKLSLFPYQLRQSWDRLVFSGTGQAPTTVSSNEDMLSRIMNTPGAIGYLETTYVNDEIHVLQIK
ncbi:MAG: substrate-binding domain-containing protein [Nitrosomonas sp.]|nr:substrate-binding domain-containing protein [Nitrosomonas sp.]